jgi:hypothetical protein
VFVECSHVSDVWNQLHAWLVRNGYTQLEPFSKRDIILGIEAADIVVNLCIHIAKLSIYRCRVNNSRPTMAAVKANLKYVMCTDKYIAQTNNTMNKCYGKWASLFHSLQ